MRILGLTFLLLLAVIFVHHAADATLAGEYDSVEKFRHDTFAGGTTDPGITTQAGQTFAAAIDKQDSVSDTDLSNDIYNSGDSSRIAGNPAVNYNTPKPTNYNTPKHKQDSADANTCDFINTSAG